MKSILHNLSVVEELGRVRGGGSWRQRHIHYGMDLEVLGAQLEYPARNVYLLADYTPDGYYSLPRQDVALSTDGSDGALRA